MNEEQEFISWQRSKYNDVMDEIDEQEKERKLNILECIEITHHDKHVELIHEILKFHKMKKQNKNPNRWVIFLNYYSSTTGKSFKLCMIDPECKRLYRLNF